MGINRDGLLSTIEWVPVDLNNQEYGLYASFRIAEEAQMVTEQLTIKSDGQQWPHTKFFRAMRVKDGKGRLLIECKDAGFPSDSNWSQELPACAVRPPDVAHCALLNCLP